MKKLTTLTTTLLAVVVIMLLAGGYYFFGHGTMSRTPMLYGMDSADGIIKSYLERALPHHIEAINSAREIMVDKDITMPEVRLLAARIADSQEFEVGQMKTWYKEWFALPVPLFVYQSQMTKTDKTGDERAVIYLKDMIKQDQYEIDQARDTRAYVEEIEKRKSSTDGQLTITNSHPGIDTTLVFTKQVEDEKTKEISEIKALLKKF